MAALFRKKVQAPEGAIQGQDEVLGWLDEMIRQRVVVELHQGGKVFRVMLDEAEDPGILFRERSGGLGPSGGGYKAFFPMDGGWYGFAGSVSNGKEGLRLSLPDFIQRVERRGQARTVLSGRESGTVSILEQLGKGVGVLGDLVNLSATGICLNIKRVLVLETEKEIAAHAQIYKPGQALALVRIKGVPNLPMLETEGRFVWAARQPGGWRMAVALPNMDKKARACVERFVQPRIGDTDPVRRSRQRRREMEARRREMGGEGEVSPSSLAADPETSPGQAPVEAASAPLEGEAGAYGLGASVRPEEPREQAQAASVILAFGDGLVEDEMPAVSDWGYQLMLATSPLEISRVLRENNPRDILCSLQFKGQETLPLLEKLNQMNLLEGVRIHLLADQGLNGVQVIKCRMLGIRSVLAGPLEEPAILEARLKRDSD